MQVAAFPLPQNLIHHWHDWFCRLRRSRHCCNNIVFENDPLSQQSLSSRHVLFAQFYALVLQSDRVSTYLTEQISTRFQDGSEEKSRTYLHCFGLLCNVPNLIVCRNIWKNIIIIIIIVNDSYMAQTSPMQQIRQLSRCMIV